MARARLGASRGSRGATPHVDLEPTHAHPAAVRHHGRRRADRAEPPRQAARRDLIAYFEGEYVPLRDAKVSIMTHAFMYGTATFEGIRGYWNAEQETLYVLFVREHIERIRNSAKMLLMENAAAGGRAGRDRPGDGPPQSTSARTSTSARRSTRAPRRSASGSTTSITSCT